LGTKVTRHLGIMAIIGIGTHIQAAQLVRPTHQGLEVLA
jgi:hypothetical protein